jgi:2-polyprenyl-6-methoxyphenol hydroxylase-like FAD-dependent oxidoreductase
VAGPTAAYWLSRAGFSVTIIERWPTLRPGGQAVDIRTAGVSVMRRTPGMEAAVRAKTVGIEGIQIVRPNGTPYGTLRPTGNPDQQSLVSEYEIYRGDLAEILYNLSREREGVKYVFGEQVRSIRQSESDKGEAEGPVTVEFANGKLATQDFDLVVACDGATSRTRAIGLECGVRDHIVPINSWAAYFSMKKDIMQGSKMGQGFSTPGGRFIALGQDHTGVTRATLFSIHPRNDPDALLPFREANKQGDDALKKLVKQRFAGAGWKTDEVLEDIMDSKDFYASEVVQVKTPVLSRGRFVLVGDAGYAGGPTGGGTSLAMAGAYVLAGELCKHQGNIAAGLKGYEETMRPIIAELQKIPPGIPGIMAPQTAWGVWLRNHIFMLLTRLTPILGVLQKWFGAAFSEVEKFKLPDYEWLR